MNDQPWAVNAQKGIQAPDPNPNPGQNPNSPKENEPVRVVSGQQHAENKCIYPTLGLSLRKHVPCNISVHAASVIVLFLYSTTRHLLVSGV